jgi:hypothetical protein
LSPKSTNSANVDIEERANLSLPPHPGNGTDDTLEDLASAAAIGGQA